MDLCDRRVFITLSVASFLRLSFTLPSLAQAAQRANRLNGLAGSPGTLNWEAFLEYVDREARGQYGRSWNQIRYVQEIEALAHTLSFADSGLRHALGSTRAPGSAVPQFTDLERRITFQVTLISFEKGQVLPLHDHPRMTGVMTCADGTIDVRRFNLVATDTGNGFCTLRDEGVARLTAGYTSWLTADMHNIHGLKAQSFSQVIDIFTPPYDSTRIKESRWFRLNQPVTPGKDVIATILSKP